MLASHYVDLKKMGDNMRQLRIKHQETTADVAQLLFNDPHQTSRIDQYERGKKVLPLKMLVCLCNHYAVRLSTILVFTEKYRHLSNYML